VGDDRTTCGRTALQLALELVPQARRILDVGCGTGQLLRWARPCYPTATLVGVDLAAQMVSAAIAVTPTQLGVRYVRACAEHLPFTHDVFDLVFATLSLRHWTNPPAGIAEISRVLIPGGMLILADVFPNQRHHSSVRPRLRRFHAAVPTDLDGLLAAAYTRAAARASLDRSSAIPARSRPGTHPRTQ
jgi:ubiquinone/menaquinone biosynthesis C-methylase UbiE